MQSQLPEQFKISGVSYKQDELSTLFTQHKGRAKSAYCDGFIYKRGIFVGETLIGYLEKGSQEPPTTKVKVSIFPYTRDGATNYSARFQLV